MKIKIGDKVYIQRYDLQFLFCSEAATNGIISEYFQKNDVFEYEDTISPFDFNFFFAKKENVEWIMGQAWILDYGEYKDKTIEFLQTQADDYQKKIDESIAKGKQDPGIVNDFYLDERDKLEQARDSIRYLISEKAGVVSFVLPESP